MRLITLGTAAAGVPRAGDAGSGHLLIDGDTHILLDCGAGVLGRLVDHARFEDLDAIFLTHMHHDHVADLYALALWARFRKHSIPTYAPAGTRTHLFRWFSAFSDHPEEMIEPLKLVEVDHFSDYRVADLTISVRPVQHNIVAHAYRVTDAAGRTLVYTGDTRAGAPVIEAAQDADLLLAEATFQDIGSEQAREATRDHHMTAREAGEVAAAAGAKRLVLTHLRYDLDAAASVKEAELAYRGPVEVATPGATFEI